MTFIIQSNNMLGERFASVPGYIQIYRHPCPKLQVLKGYTIELRALLAWELRGNVRPFSRHDLSYNVTRLPSLNVMSWHWKVILLCTAVVSAGSVTAQGRSSADEWSHDGVPFVRKARAISIRSKCNITLIQLDAVQSLVHYHTQNPVRMPVI